MAISAELIAVSACSFVPIYPRIYLTMALPGSNVSNSCPPSLRIKRGGCSPKLVTTTSFGNLSVKAEVEFTENVQSLPTLSTSVDVS